MAYRILYGSEILWEPYSDEKDAITDVTLTMTVNAAKYLDFTMPPTHSLYNVIAERAETVWVYADSKIIYKGFVSNISDDFYGYKSVTCASVMDYLGDVHVRDYSTVDGEQPLTAPSNFDGLFQWYIDQYNKHCIDSKKQFKVGVNQAGILDANNYVYRSSTQFPTTAEEIENKILDYGGYLFERYDGDTNILDLYADAHEANTQILDFGVNITDFTRDTSADGLYTAVYATGYTPDPPEDDPDKEMKPISLADIQNGGSPYNADFAKLDDVLYSPSAVQRYGYREYYYSNDDITTTDYLLKASGVVLTKLLSPTLTLDVKAVDLALFMDNGYEHLQLGQAVRVRSKPHNTDEYLMISGIDLDLQDPGNTSYTIGTSYDTLTGQQSSYLKSLNANINSSLDSVASLGDDVKKSAKDAKDAKTEAEEAKKNAEEAAAKADEANTKSDEANAKVDEAAEKINTAISDAKDAADKASEASKKADEATAKTELIEKSLTEISGNTDQAIANAQKAQDAADAAKKAADDAQASAEANATEVGKVKSQVETINTEISDVKSDATKLRDDLSGQITTVKNTMEADYSRKSDLTDTTETLRNEISESAAGVLRTVSTDYATKSELKTTTDATNKNAQDLTTAIKKFDGDINSLQGQIDGSIQTWFYEVVPTDQNEPAVNWTTTDLKNVHLGDLYYDTITGYCYRYQVQNNVYSWQRITDVDVTKALSDAAKAQDTADHKRRVFVATPTTPYDVGDLWVQGTNGDIMRCQVAKTSSQTYAAADWVKASKYTDDTATNTLSNYVEKTYSTKSEVKQLSDTVSSTVSSLETVKTNAEAAQTSANNAKAAADAAQKAADTAKANAATAQSTADAAKKNLETAQKNLETLQSQANATDADLATAKANVEKAQKAADTAQTAADTAKTNASTAQATADAAKIAASNAQKDVDSLKDRVTKAETSITQNAEAIALRATKTEVTNVASVANLKGIDYSQGKMLYTDPSFASGTNKTYVYNNSSNSNVTVTRTAKSSDNPMTGTSYELTITNVGTSSPGCGGFYFGTMVRANAIFIYRIIAKIPTGYAIGMGSNSIGTNGGSINWLTSTAGTGTFKEYIMKVVCGSTGTFANTGYFYINGSVGSSSSPVKWYVAYATCFDMTNIGDAKAVTDNLANNYSTTTQMNSAIEQSANSITSTVSKTYQTKSDMSNYATSTEMTSVKQTVSDLTTSIKSTITTAKVEYALGTSQTTAPTSGWSTTAPAWQSGKYMWQKTTYTTSDGTTSTSTTCIQGAQGPQGSKGDKGDTGNTGAKGDGLDIKDTRSTNQNPQWYFTNYPKTTVHEFKYCSTIGLSNVGTYCDLITYVPWADSSGGYPKQTAKVGESGKEFWRVGTSNTAWSSWYDALGVAQSAKTSTDTLETLIRQSGNGVEVAKKVNGSYTSTKTLMGSDGFYVQDASGNTLSSFKQNSVSLGLNSADAEVDLCGDYFTFSTSAESGGNRTASISATSSKMIIRSKLACTIKSTSGPISIDASGDQVSQNESIIFSIPNRSGALNDWVVSEGTSGYWYYRKWASGRAECWGYVKTSEFNINSSLGGGWYYNGSDNIISSRAYPFAFTSVPNEYIWITVYGNSGSLYSTFTSAASSNTASSSRSYQVFRYGSNNGFYAICQYYVEGRWK